MYSLFVDTYFEMHEREDIRTMRKDWEENYTEYYAAMVEQNAYDKLCEGIDDPAEMDEAQGKYDELYCVFDWLEKHEDDGFGRIWRFIDRQIGHLLDGYNPNIRYPHVLDDDRADAAIRKGYVLIYDDDELHAEHQRRSTNRSLTHENGH